MSLSAHEFAPGVVLDGRYEVLYKIGSGGMGAVYAAKRLALGDSVAIKQLHPVADTEENRSRLLIEARAAAHIRHPSVVKIFDFGRASDGAPYLVMEHLEGTDLEQVLDDVGRLPVPRALELFAPVCAAVEAGHRRGVIHRDIKPGNVLISQSDDGREVVKVLDFGLAVIGKGPGPASEQTGEFLGTPQYMAPETVRGGPVSPATDVFALGVLLYQMLTGALPFGGKTPYSVLLAVMKGEYRSAADVVPELPVGLVEVIDRALETEPMRRPASPEQLARLAERAVAAPRAVRVSEGVASESVSHETPDLEVFISRERELAFLHQEYQRSLGGDGRLVMVLGEPGIGKTRLVERFANEVAQPSRAVVVWGRFFEDRGGRRPAYETFRAMLSTAPGTSTSGTLPLGASTRDTVDEQRPRDLEGEGSAWRLHTAAADDFAALAGSRPLVLVLDDLQWAGRADLELLEHLHRALAQRGTLVLATVRRSPPNTEIRCWQLALAARRASVELELSAFGVEEVERFLERAFGAVHIHPSDLRRLHRAASGNPYFLAETVRHLLADGQMSYQGGWRCQSLDTLDLPPTITHLIEARLGELEDDLRRVLEVAAVVGDAFHCEVLAAAAGIAEDVLEARLEQAEGEGLLRAAPLPGGGDYAFASETVRRVLYDALSPGRRRRTHRQVIEALHRLHGETLKPLALALADHSAAVENWPETLTWGLQAAEQALEHYDSDAAESMLQLTQRAAERLRTAPPAEVRARLDLASGVLERRLGHLDSAKAKLLRALDLAPAGGGGEEIRLELARCQLALGELESALRSAREVAANVGSDPSHALLLRAGMCEASALLRLGRAPEAADRLDALLVRAGEEAPLFLRSRILRESAWAALKRGAFAAAERQARQSFDLARAAGDLLAQHHALSALAAIRGETGDVEGSLPYHQRALELARRLSLRRREGIDLANIGEQHFRLDELDLAHEHFHAALAIFVEIGDRACEGDCRVNIGRTLLARGETDPALETLSAARRLCEATGRSEYVGIAWIHEGGAHLERESLEQARTAYNEARRLFEAQNSHLLWQAELGLARVSKLAGDLGSARWFAQRAGSRLVAQRADLASEVDARSLDREVAEVDALQRELRSKA